jgi:iron(III) transport system permease protein
MMTKEAVPEKTSGVRRRASRPLGVSPIVAVVAVLAATTATLPLLYLLIQASSRGLDNVVQEIWQRRTLDLVLRSLSLALVVTVLSLVVGVFTAFFVVRTNLPGYRIFAVVLVLPLAIPSYVSAYAWISWLPWLAGFWGAVLVLTSISFPFVFLPVVASLRRIDARQDDVARSLGLTSSQVAFRLTLRQIRPAATAGALMVGLYSLSDFGAVATMRFESFTWVIFGSYRAGFNPTRAATLSLVLVVISVIFVWLEFVVRGDGRAATVGAGVSHAPDRLDLGANRIPAAALLVGVVVVTLAIPLVLVLRWFFEAAGTGVDSSELLGAVRQTVFVSFLATVGAIFFAVPAAVLAARVKARWAQSTERTVFVIHALPGIVIGLAVVYLGIRLVPSMYQRLPMLIFAYVVLFMSLAVGSVRASVEISPIALEDSARSLGLSRFAVFRTLTLPLARPGIMAGAALVFLTVMKELPATILLRPTGMDTLATELWNRTSVADYAAASPYALLLILIAAIPAALLTVTRETR